MEDGRQCFEPAHPWAEPTQNRAWAESLVRESFGEQHVGELDWYSSLVVEH